MTKIKHYDTMIKFRLSNEDRKRLQAIGAELQMSESELVRTAIKNFLAYQARLKK